MALSGCVSAAKDTAASAAEETVPVVASAEGAEPADGSYRDQQVAAMGGSEQQEGATAGQTTAVPPARDGQSGRLETSGLNATSGSIFSSRPAEATVQPQQSETGENPVPLPVKQQTGVNPTSNSLFNSGEPSPQPLPLPTEGTSNETGPGNAAQQSSLDKGPDRALAADTAQSRAETDDQRQPVQIAADQPMGADGAVATAAVPRQSRINAGRNAAPARALFAANPKSDDQFDDDRFAKPAKKTILAKNSKGPQKIAALGFTQLPGVQTTSMFATMDDAQASHDDENAAVQMASLPGLARLAPNGLLLQTEKVETGCFQPELLKVLKVVEAHYGRQVMVTSGLRDLKHNKRAGGRRASFHTTCQAADIQVPGVSKWELSDYLRTIPGRGGVGTYCHTESVHIDIGEQRDWNWRCRRRTKS